MSLGTELTVSRRRLEDTRRRGQEQSTRMWWRLGRTGAISVERWRLVTELWNGRGLSHSYLVTAVMWPQESFSKSSKIRDKGFNMKFEAQKVKAFTIAALLHVARISSCYNVPSTDERIVNIENTQLLLSAQCSARQSVLTSGDGPSVRAWSNGGTVQGNEDGLKQYIMVSKDS